MTAAPITSAAAGSSSPVAVSLEDAQVEAATLLRQLDGYRDQLQRLRDSRQPSDFSFTSFVPRSTREAIGRQYRADRLAQLEAQAAGYPTTLGNTHAQGNLAAWSLAAEIETTLVDLRKRILDAHSQRRTCAIPRSVYGRLEKETLFQSFRELVFTIPTVTLARHVNRQLQHLVDQAERLLEGDERTELDSECPHCRRRTLVVYLRAGTISCERARDRETGRRPRCLCSDPLCGCRTNPAGYVHTWYRDRPPGAADSWSSLSGRLSLTHLARKKDRR